MKKIVRSARTLAHGVLALGVLLSAQQATAQGVPRPVAPAPAAPPQAAPPPPAAPPAAPPHAAAPAAPPSQAPAAPPPQAAPPPPPAQPHYAPAPSAPPAPVQAVPPPPAPVYQPPPAGYPAPMPAAPPYAGAAPVYQYERAPLYQPAGNYPRPARPRKGMMVAGIAILGGAYLLSTTVAVSLFEDDDDDLYDSCPSCNRVAPWLFLPVFGPFVAMTKTRDDAGDSGLYLLGMAQLVGLALTIGGAIRYRNTKRAAEQQGFASWELPKERRLALEVASSQRFTGPTLRLDF